MKRALAVLLLLAAGCGRSGTSPTTGEPTPTPTAEPTATPDDGIAGIWTVSGSDSIGSFTGEIELIEESTNAFRFARVVNYSVTVEDGRELWLAWTGAATRAGGTMSATLSLKKADFIASRDALVRTLEDATPISVSGSFTKDGTSLTGSFSGAGFATTEAWTDRRVSSTKPIFAEERALVLAHEPPSSDFKNAAFATFASYHEQPWVVPYVGDPRFQTAVHGHWMDRTDFDFYRANPNALRIVNKVVDPISQQETLARANAFGRTLAQKVAFFDAELKNDLIDPITNMVVAERVGDTYQPSGDGALWTGAWIAAQAFRFQVTAESEARDNVARSIDSLLRLQEITGDPATFARTLRASTGAPAGSWHAGTGANAHLEWLEGGNNDMYKGLLYGYLTAYRVLCDGVAGYEPICQRIRANSETLADDVGVAQNGMNGLSSKWLAAYVTGDFGRRLEAEGAWMANEGIIEQGNVMIYEQGIADWSGTHLNVVQYISFFLLQERLPLVSGDVDGKLRAGVDVAQGEVEKQRLVMWNLAGAALGASPDEPALDDAISRLRELSCPKMQIDIDHRIDVAEFALSPYPSLPWKNDWTTNEGRAQSLNGVPLFEKFYTDYLWKDNPHGFREHTVGQRKPGTDFSHAYWFGRRFGVLAGDE